MSNRIVCFSHGKESGPWGTKIKVLAEVAQHADWAVESIDYRGLDDPQLRVARLADWCVRQTVPFVLVGSSMGGHVALAAAGQHKPLGVFVMAPALFVPGYEQWTPEPPEAPVTIVHGWRDDVVPWQGSLRFAEQCRASLTLLDSDHRLIDVLDEIAQRFRIFLKTMHHSLNEG
ncbi:MAG: alpha/beta fold hydrolase [Gammaproteobacteria bacterium]